MSASDWNPANPLESFQLFAESIHEQAKEFLLRDKTHGEMFFFIALNGQGHLVLWKNSNSDDDRNEQADWVRQRIHKDYIYGMVHVCEAWAHFAKRPNEHTQRQLEAGEMKVSDLNPQDRSDVLMVSAQSRDGYAHCWIDEILKDKANESLLLGECRELKDFAGRFGKLFG